MRRFDSRALCLLLLAAPGASAQATAAAASPGMLPAPAPVVSPLADAARPPAPAATVPRVAAWLGAGSVWLPSEGLDPFAEDDALVMFSAGAAFGLAGDERLGVAAVAGFDATGSEASARGAPSSLGLMRLALGPELRGAIAPRLFWHGRLSPTLTRLSAELEDPNGVSLAATRWVWGAEATAGLDLRFAEVQTTLPAALGFFVRLEGGYAWSPSTTLTLGADGNGAPVRTQGLELGELALAGPIFRASVGVGF